MSRSHPATLRLLAAARAVVPDAGPIPDGGDTQAGRDAFLRAYRAWVSEHHSIEGSPGERMEKVRLLMTAMCAAPDLGAAIGILLRFAPLTYGGLTPVAIEEQDDQVRLRIDRPLLSGVAGLIGELWPLALHLSQLECLAGRMLGGAHGEVRLPPLLPAETAGLLFDRPVVHDRPALALCFPRQHLRLAVVATADEVAHFLPRMLPATFEPAGAPAECAALVEALLRFDRLRGAAVPADLDSIAARLGFSGATLRRRLAREGASFRAIRAAVQDAIAKQWLRTQKPPIGVIAERLGYVDLYSFRRAFTRQNGCSPAAFRRAALRNGDEG